MDTNIVRGSLPEVTDTQDERLCACTDGLVFIGHVLEDPETGEEMEAFEAVPCRRCQLRSGDSR